MGNHTSGSILILVAFELAFVGLCLTGSTPRQRRAHFWLRVFLASLFVPSLFAMLVMVARLKLLSDDAAKAVSLSVWFIGVMALMLVPGLLYRSADSSSDPPESDGGGGPGPKQPPFGPEAPRGGVPLQDADQASARARDHSTPQFGRLKRRRPAHEPRRAPVRTNR